MSVRWMFIFRIVIAITLSFILLVIAWFPANLGSLIATHSLGGSYNKISFEAWRNGLFFALIVSSSLGGIGYFINYKLLKNKLAGWIVFGLIVFFGGIIQAILENPF